MKILEGKSEFYWFHLRHGLLLADGAANHVQYVEAHSEIFGISAREIVLIYHSYGEPVGTEGKARQVIIDAVLKKGFLRARHWSQGLQREWYIEVRSAREQKRLIRRFLDSVSDSLRPEDEVHLLDNQSDQTIMTMRELLQLVEQREQRRR